MIRKLLIAVFILGFFSTGWTQERTGAVQSQIDENQRQRRERLTQMRQKVDNFLSVLPADPCVTKLRLEDQATNILADIDGLLDDPLIPSDIRINSIQRRMDLIEGEIRLVKRIDTRMRRIEKRIDRVNSMIQDLEGQEFQKMESVINRVSELYQKAQEKRQACEVRAAERLVAELEAIGKKTRNEIRKKMGDANRIQKYIRRNGVMLEKAGGRIESEDEKKLYDIALSLHDKSKTALSEKEYQKAWRAAVSCREKIFDLGKDLLSAEEKAAIKKRVEAFIKRTVKAVEKAGAIAQKSGNADLARFVQTAKEDLRKAKSLHEKGHDAKAMNHLKKANRIATKIIETASRVRNISQILERLEKRYERVGVMMKDTQDDKAKRAYENAGKHFEAAKRLAQAGKNQEAAEEAKLAVKLLGKAVHRGVKNDPKVAEEVKEELKRVREKVKTNLEEVKESDNQAAKALGKQALQQLSKAKAWIQKKHYKQALQHLFKAAALSEKAVHVMHNRSNPELEEDTDLEEETEK